MIEPLEPRLAPATGLTVTHLPGNALHLTATEGDDGVYIRSDEPGFLTVGSVAGDLILDGLMVANPITIPMPKGAVSIDLLGGSDQLALDPMTLPGSLTVNDSTGPSRIGITNVLVRGSMTINGSSDNDTITVDGRLGVTKDLTLELRGGTGDLFYNTQNSLSFTVGGNFKIHGTAATTIVALGLSLDGNLVRKYDDNRTQYDVPLMLRELKVGKNLTFEASGTDVRLLLSAANEQVGGILSAKATASNGVLGFLQGNAGPLNIAGGLVVEAGGLADVRLNALSISIGRSISFTGGIGNDVLSVIANNGMRLPKTTLNLGDGNNTAGFRAFEPWTLTGSLAVTAGSGDDLLSVLGPGKITGNLTGDFGSGMAGVTVNGDGNGRMSIGPIFKMTSQSNLLVGIYNAVMNGRVEVTGHGGDDALSFDSVKVVGAVAFTGSAGADGFYVDGFTANQPKPPLLYFTPSVFTGAVRADMGDGIDHVIFGSESDAGRANFLSSVSVLGIMGETLDPIASTVKFKKAPVYT
jgi:hypothetical protein